MFHTGQFEIQIECRLHGDLSNGNTFLPHSMPIRFLAFPLKDWANWIVWGYGPNHGIRFPCPSTSSQPEKTLSFSLLCKCQMIRGMNVMSTLYAKILKHSHKCRTKVLLRCTSMWGCLCVFCVIWQENPYMWTWIVSEF